MKFTSSEENYIKTIFHLQAEKGKVNTNTLAIALQTRPASVTDMLKKLNGKQVVHYKPYYGFYLSTEGEKVALNVIRRHRLWEYFLSEKLKFSWEEVHALAEELEHVSSKKLIDKLDAFLDYPSFDPHGDPIPNQRGKMKQPHKVSLDQLSLHTTAIVCQVSHQSADLLELLRHKKIGIGSTVQVKQQFQYDQSLEVKLKNTTLTISHQLAKNIFVTYEPESKK